MVIITGTHEISVDNVGYLLKKKKKEKNESSEPALVRWQLRIANDKTSLSKFG